MAAAVSADLTVLSAKQDIDSAVECSQKTIVVGVLKDKAKEMGKNL